MRPFRFLFPLVSCVALAGAESIPEPGTVFYGKVLVPSGGGYYQLTEGELAWSIVDPDGRELEFDTSLESIGGGKLSYRLAIPHSAAAPGAPAGSGDVALGSSVSTASHLRVVVNGKPARLTGTGGTAFDLAQALRGSTHRVDLAVGIELADSDGDGMHDWWEEQHGLDPYSAADAAGDGDRDGVTNLAEFLAGTDPTLDDRRPRIFTRELLFYGDLANGVQLEVRDSDTPIEELRFTLVTAPAGVQFMLAGQDELLAPGTSFWGEDLRKGRLQARIVDDEFTSGAMQLAVVDGKDREAVPAKISLRRILLEDDDARSALLAIAREEKRTVWDLRAFTQPIGLDLTEGGNSNLMFVGGSGGMVTASSRDDRIVLFVPELRNPLSVHGFRTGGHDQLDLSPALGPQSGDLRQTVRLENSETLVADTITISLPSNEADLRTLWEGKHLLLDGLSLPPLVQIASTTDARENGPRAGEFTITRSGDTTSALEILIQLAGSATNGVDYATVGDRVTIPAGARSVQVVVMPHADGLTEGNEVVELRLSVDEGYELGTATAQLQIIDLMPEITVEALEPVASLDGGHSGTFLIARSGLVDRSVLVRLAVTGTATPGTDYNSISPYVNFLPGQTTALVAVTPRPETAAIADGGESVNVSIREDGSYLVGASSGASVVLVAQRRTFAEIAGSGDGMTLEEFAFGSAAQRPLVVVQDGHLELRFIRPRDVVDLEWTVEYSEDLVNWRRGEEFVRDVTPLWNDGNVNRAVFRAVKAASPARTQFLRVVVTH